MSHAPGAPPPLYVGVGVGPPPGPTPSTATTSLILGIASLLCFGLLTGIPAMVLGRSATREIDRSQGVLGGRGVALAGFVTGLIGTLLSVLLILLLVGLLALGAALQDTFRDTVRETCHQVATAENPQPC